MNITNINLALKKLTFYPNNSYVREANEMHDIREKNYNVSAAPTNMQQEESERRLVATQKNQWGWDMRWALNDGA